uniref:Uncharacterized protein n=1 Tax=Arundo donax TaxID=35708 RepID=A0A0A9LQ70_ARUDO
MQMNISSNMNPSFVPQMTRMQRIVGSLITSNSQFGSKLLTL